MTIDLIDEKELSKILKINIRTLQQYRYNGIGPRYIKLGNQTVRYRRSEVYKWVDECERRACGKIKRSAKKHALRKKLRAKAKMRSRYGEFADTASLCGDIEKELRTKRRKEDEINGR